MLNRVEIPAKANRVIEALDRTVQIGFTRQAPAYAAEIRYASRNQLVAIATGHGRERP
jgi:hypothetical protein